MSIAGDIRRSGSTYRKADFRQQGRSRDLTPSPRAVSDHGAVIESLSDEEIVIWRLQFGEWPPIRIGYDRRERIKRMCDGEKAPRLFDAQRRERERQEIEAITEQRLKGEMAAAISRERARREAARLDRNKQRRRR